MLLTRNTEKSMRYAIASLLANPPAGSGFTNAWNVYGEDTFQDTDFKPNFPFVWVMDVRVPPMKTRLPMILIERAPVQSSLFEIGNRAGTYFTFNFHVFGRNRGERSDLAEFLREQITTFTLYDWTNTPAALQYTVDVDRRDTEMNSVAPDIGAEGALNNWETVSFSFQLRS